MQETQDTAVAHSALAPAITKEEFDQAVARLIGDDLYEVLSASGYTRPGFCKHIATSAFVNRLQSYPGQEDDLQVVRTVATNLWYGEGVTGLIY